MKIRALHSFSIFILLSTVTFEQLVAQVDYSGDYPWSQRAESGPDAQVPGWFYNLGITGVRAELVKDNPKAPLAKYVFPGTPAHTLIKINDWVIGVNRQKFQNEHRNGYGMEVFGADGPVAELAEALEACQGKSGNGKLPLMVKRGRKTITVELEIGKKYGSYAATYPAKCLKSEKILNELLDCIAKQQNEDGSFGDPVQNTFAALALERTGTSVTNQFPQSVSRLHLSHSSPPLLEYHWQASAKFSRHPRIAAHGHGIRSAGCQHRPNQLPEADDRQPMVVHHGPMQRRNLLLPTESR